jgi:hypothetical protein
MGHSDYFCESSDRLRKFLSQIGVDAEGLALVFVRREHVHHLGSIARIPSSRLLSTEEFVGVFDHLCSEGRSWLHLDAIGIHEGQLVVEVDAGTSVGNPRPTVNFSASLAGNPPTCAEIMP